MKIAIVERSLRYAEAIRQMVLDWSRMRHYQGLGPIALHSAKSLRYELEDGHYFDLVFLSAAATEEAGGLSRFAGELRKRDAGMAVVWIADNDALIETAFEMGIYQYLTDPVVSEKICRVMDRLAAELKKRRDHYGEFNGIDGRMRLSYDDILYLKAAMKDHHAFIHRTDGTVFEIILSGRSFFQFACSLPAEQFVQCHRSYIVNRKYVTAVFHEKLILSYEKEVPVGRHFYPALIDPAGDENR